MSPEEQRARREIEKLDRAADIVILVTVLVILALFVLALVFLPLPTNFRM